MTQGTLTEKIRLACLLEATARKAGNVHPQASFEHLTYRDFVHSADAAAPVLAEAGRHGVGRTIHDAVIATRERCRSNTNLGIILLLAPLSAVPRSCSLTDGIEAVLKSLTIEDAEFVFEAIRIAAPRGLGTSQQQDVSDSQPKGTLREVMSLAADRDSIAAEYANGFRRVLTEGVPILVDALRQLSDWEQAVLHLQLALMASIPDTDILRKCGRCEADESARQAEAVLQAGGLQSEAGRRGFNDFDHWLRERGSSRNPGTTADLVTACLFVVLRDELAELPDETTIREIGTQLANAMFAER